MNVNFGLFPPLEAPRLGENGKRLRGKAKTLARKRALSERALGAFLEWLESRARLAA
jgi:methylenetetrahydrofolate--tRNA-(uracil-5-)-methyltransferase